MSTFGSTISRYNDWFNKTRAQRLLPPDKVMVEARRRTYLLPKLLKRDMAEMVQNGKHIEDQMILTDPKNMAYRYTPGQDRDSSRIDLTVNFVSPFRYVEVAFPYTEEEVRHNGEAGSNAEFVKFKSFRDHIKQYLYLAMLNNLEDHLFGVPSQAQMEAGSVSTTTTAVPGEEYTIPSFVCEGTEGANGGYQPPTSVWAGANIQGVSTTTYSLYRNAVATYDKTAHDDEDNGIFAAMDRMASYIKFDRVPGYEKYAGDETDFSQLAINTNRDGLTIYQKLLRGINDQTRGGPQDPAYGEPTYHGVPVHMVDSLNTLQLDQAYGATPGTPGAYTSQAYPSGSPRYFFNNFKYLKPVFGWPQLMEMTDPINGAARQPDGFTVFLRAKYNLVCLSRQRQGIIHPNS